MTQPNDATLMKRAQNGDQDAFSILVHRHVDSLYNYALRLSSTPANAEDLVQDTWLAAWQHAARYRAKKAKLTTWLHSILYNKFVDSTRKKHSLLNMSATDLPEQPDHDEQRFFGGENERKLYALMNALPVNQRSALVLHHLQGFSNGEVAVIMGSSVRAIESLLARARESLKKQYGQETQNP